MVCRANKNALRRSRAEFLLSHQQFANSKPTCYYPVMPEKAPVSLIDDSAYLYRAYHYE